MKQFSLILSCLFLAAGSAGLRAQAFQGFEGRNTDADCTANTCQYFDQVPASMAHELQDYTSGSGGFFPVNDAPVINPAGPDVLGFKSFFRPTRVGGTGLGEGDLFGYVKGAAISSSFGPAAFEGDQIFMIEDSDGEVTMEFTPVRLAPGSMGNFSMQYIYDDSFETGTVNDRLYIALNVTECSAANTITLLDSDGGGSGGGGAGGSPPGAARAWHALTTSLTPYGGCTVQLVIEVDINSASEEIGFDAINFAAGSVLPVEFISIAANQRKDAVVLDWSTATETDNRGFSVERSTNGRSFAPIGWVTGKGEAQAQVDYEFEDNNVRAGQEYYYRLRQEDFDGAFAYSSIVKVTMTGEASDDIIGRVFPNPAVAGRSNVELYPTRKGDWTFSVLDLNGRTLAETSHTLAAGYNLVPLDLKQQPTGTYLVRIAGKEQTFYRKVIR